VLVIYQNEKTGKLATHKHRFRPQEGELRALIAELMQDTGVLALWVGPDDAQWFIFEKGVIFREEATQEWRPRVGARVVDPEEIVTAYRTIR
jgi:hypothetical protein